jgi:N-acetylmuramoyl-L-alanine amidase
MFKRVGSGWLRSFLGALVVATCSMSPSAALAAGHPSAPGVQLRRIELQSTSEAAVLTLSLSGPVSQHVFSLHNPERLVIDLPDTRRIGALPTPAPGGAVTAIRSGQNAPLGLRLVLELDSRMQLQQRALQAGGAQLRLALQRPQTPTVPAAAPVRERAAPVPAAAPVRERAAPALTVRAAHVPGAESRPIIIAVDAGHGGDDPGASGAGGTHEKDVTLAIARSLAARIDREPGMRAVMTRNGDYFVDLVERRERAKAAHADMFVSIHADAIRDREVSGASVYVLSDRGASSQAAKILAEEQNAADLRGGIPLAGQRPELRSVLLNLKQNASMADSSEAADRVLTALDGVGAVRKREVQQAAFVVLKSPDIPSMLIETAYISNPTEERMLRTPSYQQRLADAIVSGIDSYFRKYPPDGSLFAHQRERQQGSPGSDSVPLAAVSEPSAEPVAELIARKDP